MEIEVREKNREPNLIVFARQTFTPLQKDIFTLAVMQLEVGLNVQPDLFANKTVTVTAKMLNEVTEKQYARLKRECRELQTKQIEISNDAEEEFEFIIPFPRIKYKKGTIELTMLSDVAQSFLELKKGYSEYYIRESLSLEQFNKKRLYELLCSYKKRNHPIWTVYDDELKFLLGLDKNEYKGRPKQFGEKIISICVNAINELTSISVKYIRDKDSQGWYTVFTVADNTKKIKIIQTEKKELDEKSKRLIIKLKDIGIVRPDIVKKIIEEKQTETWKWLHTYKDEIAANKFKSVSGVLLVHLGIIEPKTK